MRVGLENDSTFPYWKKDNSGVGIYYALVKRFIVMAPD
jgi:hypothetical protein